MTQGDRDLSEPGIPRLGESPSSPERPPTMYAKRSLIIFASYVVTQFVVGLALFMALGVYLGAQEELGADSVSQTSDLIDQLSLPIQVVAFIIAGFVIVLLTKQTLPGRIRGGAWTSIGANATGVATLIVSLGLGCACAVGYVFVLAPIAPPEEGQDWGPLASAALAGGWQMYCWAVLALAFAPPLEEFLFRGVLFTGLSNSFGKWISALVVTVLFVFVHVAEAIYYWPAWFGLSAIAILAVLLRLKFDSFYPAIAAHFGYNFVVVAAVLVAST